MSNELERRLERALAEARARATAARPALRAAAARRCRRRARTSTGRGGDGWSSSWRRAWQRSSRAGSRSRRRAAICRSSARSAEPTSGRAATPARLCAFRPGRRSGRQQAGGSWSSPRTPGGGSPDDESTAFAASPGSLYPSRATADDCGTSRATGRVGGVHGNDWAAGRSPRSGRRFRSHRLRAPTPGRVHVGDTVGDGTHPFTVDRTPRRDAGVAMGLEGARLRDRSRGGRRPRRDRGREPADRDGCEIRTPAAIAFAPAGGALARSPTCGRSRHSSTRPAPGDEVPRRPGGPTAPRMAGPRRPSRRGRKVADRYGLGGPEAASRTVRPPPVAGSTLAGRRLADRPSLRARAAPRLAVATTPPRPPPGAPTLASGLTLLHRAAPCGCNGGIRPLSPR